MNYRRMRKAIAIRIKRLNFLLREKGELLIKKKINQAKKRRLCEELRIIEQELCMLHYRIFCHKEEKRE